MLLCNGAFAQIQVSQFNAGWNAGNTVSWTQDLKDCKTISYLSEAIPTITDDYEYEQLPYPKYEEKHNGFIWVTEGEIVEPKMIDEYIIEVNVYEKYYNIMMKYIIVFNNVKNNKVIGWIKNNEY